MPICKNEILLSFIIPVYNVESYLQECVDSILQQANSNCELILVNDGSTDSSGEICDKYLANNSNIKVIHQVNAGLSAARNAGLSIARGRYITFVDSDDKIFPDSISCIFEWIQTEGTDLCFLQMVKLYSDGSQENLNEGFLRNKLKGKTREEAVQHISSRPKYPGSACAKLYRKDFLIDKDLHFPYDRRYSEDLGFMRDCILCARDFDVLDVPYYQYRQSRQGSITSNITLKNFNDLLRFIDESVQQLTVEKKAVNTISELGMSFAAYEYCILMYLYNFLSENDKKEAYACLRRYDWVMKYATSKKGKLAHVCTQIIGIKATTKLLKMIR